MGIQNFNHFSTCGVRVWVVAKHNKTKSPNFCLLGCCLCQSSCTFTNLILYPKLNPGCWLLHCLHWAGPTVYKQIHEAVWQFFITVYYIMPVLGRYPSHSDDDITQYMWHGLLQSIALFLPSVTIYFHLTICFHLITSIQANLLTGCIISSFPQHQPLSMQVLALAHSSSSYHCGKKVWNVVEGKTMGVLRGDKAPFRDNRCATCGKTLLKIWFSSV